MLQYSCCFTGHRPSNFCFGYDEEHIECIQIKQALRDQIFMLASNGVHYFLSGMALGVDIWAAEIVLELKSKFPFIQLACILPCETQANRWHENTRERYFNILAKADYTKYISRHYTNTCMKERNYFLIDNAIFVLAVFNGNPKSGTAQTLNYAKRKNRAVSVINPQNASYTPFTIQK